MSTRAQVRFATREEGVTFSEHPNAIHAQFYVHSDGYPEGLGLEIAQSVNEYGKICNWEIESLDARHGDLEYIYYVWQAENKLAYISIFERSDYSTESWHLEMKEVQCFKCIFVGLPTALIDKYKYTDKEDHKPNTNEEG